MFSCDGYVSLFYLKPERFLILTQLQDIVKLANYLIYLLVYITQHYELYLMYCETKHNKGQQQNS